MAIDDQTGEYAGLIRIWRNPSGPRFGLIGVLPEYRGTPLAPALLKRALKAASRWGHDSFVAEVSPSNTAVHRRMVSLGAESRGRVLQLRRPHSGEIKP